MQKEIPKHISKGALVIASHIDDLIRNNIKGGNEIVTLCVSLRKEGCDIGKIVTALESVTEKWKRKTGLTEFQMDFSSVRARLKERKKQSGPVLGAIERLSNFSRFR